MRRLRFIVDRQTIRKDPDCDFNGLVSGTKGYFDAEFSFSDDWDGCRKAAAFYAAGKRYYAPLVRGVCEIPEGALKERRYGVSVLGEREGYRITTNIVEVRQNG